MNADGQSGLTKKQACRSVNVIGLSALQISGKGT